MLYLVKAVVPSGLVMWAAMELRGGYWSVQLVKLEATPAHTVTMLGSPAIHVSHNDYYNEGHTSYRNKIIAIGVYIEK